MRGIVLVVGVAACGATPRHPEARQPDPVRMAHGGTCPSDQGCEADVQPQRFEAPDSDHGPTPAPDGKKPEPTCELVGEELASQEVGNYAEPDERRDAVARHTTRCKKLALTAAERQCLLEAGKQTTLQAYCAPRMYPELPVQIATPRECTALVSALRTKMAAVKPARPAAQQRAWEAKMTVFAESCAHDRWPVAMYECTRANAMVDEPLRYCTGVAPKMLQDKIAERLQKALDGIR